MTKHSGEASAILRQHFSELSSFSDSQQLATTEAQPGQRSLEQASPHKACATVPNKSGTITRTFQTARLDMGSPLSYFIKIHSPNLSSSPDPDRSFKIEMMADNLRQEEDTARDQVNSWVARFVPLVMDNEPRDHLTTRKRLELAEKLHKELDSVTLQSSKLNAVDDHDLLSTFRMARSQISSLENDLRIRLGKLSPGDPDSLADLDQLQDRLAETAAQIEMGVSTDHPVPEVLEITTSPPNFAAAGGMLIFGLGWTSFTLFHAIFMIGGMWKAFGPAALLLLLFYSIFFAVGFGMFAGAFLAGAQERVTMQNNALTVHRKLGPITTRKTHEIDLKAEAYIGRVENQVKQGNKTIRGKGIILTKIDGSPVHLAFQTTDSKRKEILKKIQAYMESQTV